MSILVTGIGVTAPNGIGLDRFWAATLAGESGIDRLSRFDVSGYAAQLAGEIRDFDAAAYLPDRLMPQTDISTRFALVAADLALADGAVVTGDLTDYDMGVVTGNASGGFEFTHREFSKLWTRGPRAVSVYESFAWFYAVNTGQISIRNGMRGAGSALVADQAGGLDAVGHARRTIRNGTPLVLAGGVDSALDPWGWVAQIASGRLTGATDPHRGYLPFDAAAAGFVPGEGGAMLILEDADHARSRGAEYAYGEVAGYASTFDPPPGSERPSGLRRAAELAMADAGVDADGIDAVFADGAGIPAADAAEADAIRAIFGSRGVPVTVPKALTGRLYSGGGPLDIAAALLSIRDGVLPATAGTTDPSAAYDLDLVVGAPRPGPVSTALVLARGLWGFNSAVVVRKAAGWQAKPPRSPELHTRTKENTHA
ncbi:ketosynthase chain-length factor [Nocardia sp. NPDC057353]|uniref:ketosynthase chain-length factor n=1 Tax=Nocardia sp. NPDC057353 TaxID=3346104 RepID=UPI0036453477